MDRVPSARGPGSGSQASPPPRPAPPRPAFRRIPSRISAPEPPGGSGLPGSLAPPRAGGAGGGGGGWRCSRGPCAVLPPPGTRVSTPRRRGHSPSSTQPPPESRNPLPTPRLRKHPELLGAGLGGWAWAGRPGCGRGKVQPRAQGKGTRGPPGAGKAPPDHSATAQDANGHGLFHPETEIAPVQASEAGLPTPPTPGPGIRRLGSVPRRFPAYPPPPPAVFTHPVGALHTRIPRRRLGEPASRPLEPSFWVSPQPYPSPPSASSHPPQHPAGHLCPPQTTYFTHPDLHLPSHGAQPQTTPRVS